MRPRPLEGTCFLGPIATRTPQRDVFSRPGSEGNPGPSRGGGAGVGAEQGRGRRVGRGKTSMPIGPIKHDTSRTSEAQTDVFLSLLDEKVPNGTRRSQIINGCHGNSGPGTRPGKELVLIYIWILIPSRGWFLLRKYRAARWEFAGALGPNATFRAKIGVPPGKQATPVSKVTCFTVHIGLASGPPWIRQHYR